MQQPMRRPRRRGSLAGEKHRFFENGPEVEQKTRFFPPPAWGPTCPLPGPTSASSGTQGSATRADPERTKGGTKVPRARPLHPRRRPMGPPRTPRGAQGASGAPPRRQYSEFSLGKTCVPAFRPKTGHGTSRNAMFGEGAAPGVVVGERRRFEQPKGTSKALTRPLARSERPRCNAERPQKGDRKQTEKSGFGARRPRRDPLWQGKNIGFSKTTLKNDFCSKKARTPKNTHLDP